MPLDWGGGAVPAARSFWRLLAGSIGGAGSALARSSAWGAGRVAGWKAPIEAIWAWGGAETPGVYGSEGERA